MRPTHGGAPPWRPQREPHGSPADYRNRHRDDGPWARRHDSYRFDAPSFGQRTFQWRPEATDSHGHTPRPPGHQISGNGKLLFSNFHIHGIDRDDITLESLEDGLRISGPVGLHARGLEFFTVSYKVTALDETMPILGASLELDSITEPGHPLAMVFAGTTLFGKGNAFFPEWKRLETYDIGGHIEHPSDHTDFRKP